MERAAFGRLPTPVRPLIAPLVRRSLRKALKGQGTGRLSDQENDGLSAENARAIASVLGERPYLLADRPCGSDATILDFANAATGRAFPGPIRDSILAEPNLKAYRDRLANEFLPECDLAML